MSKRYFINNLDTHFGQVLFQQLVKDLDQQDPIHICTMRDINNIQKPKGIKKILKRHKPKLSRKKMLQQCDVYIYDVHDTDASDIQFGVSIFDKGPPQEQKLFILVSDIRTWGMCEKKIKQKQQMKENQEEDEQQKQHEEKKEQEHPQQKQDEQQLKQGEQKLQQLLNQNQNDNQQDKSEEIIQYCAYVDNDYQKRKPLPSCQLIKQLQDLVLNIKKENVKVLIICSGIRYGQGQVNFYQHFKAAWLQNPYQLPYLNQGNNLIPCIHINDLAKFVIKSAQSVPQQQKYLLAFDKQKDRRQKTIVGSISRVVGSGKVISVQQSQLIENRDVFQLNIDVEPSVFLVGTEQQPVEFEWRCEFGLQENCLTVLEEFEKKHKLRPIKILMYTPQQQRNESRYQYLCDQQSIINKKYYRIPILKIQNILQEQLEKNNDQLTLDLKDQWDNIQLYFQQGKPKPLDQTMKVYYRVIKQRLTQNDCRNRGYILDCFPKFIQEAEVIFLPMGKKLKRKIKRIPPVITDEIHDSKIDDNEDDQKRDQNDQNKVQQAEAQIQQAKVEEAQEEEQKKQQEQEQEQQEGEEQKPKLEKFFPESMIIIKNLEINKRVENCISQWISRKKIEVMLYDIQKINQYQILEQVRIYIERNNTPFNYLTSEDQIIDEHNNYYKKKHQLNQNQKTQKKQSQQHKTDNIRQNRISILEKQIENIKSNQQTEQIQMTRKIPFRNYLMQFVIPVSNIIPDDPVQLLAQLLFNKSYD